MIILSEHPLLNEEVEANGGKIIYIKGDKILDYNNNKDVVAIAGSRALSREVLKMNFPSLKLFQLTSAGFDNVPVEEYKKRGVYVCNAGNVYSTPIAETVLYGMLQFEKRYWNNPKHKFLRPFRKYKYIGELSGKKLLILGCGNIGTAVAVRANAFGMDTFGYDPYCAEKMQYNKIYRNEDDLKENIGIFDYIVCTMPDNEQTRGFIDAGILSKCKSDAVIVNVGRKSVFNEQDFYEVLKKRTIQGAVLDMFEKLPNPITNKFRRLNNVIVMPGVSAISKEVRYRLSEFISLNVLKVLNGTIPVCVISE